MINADFVISDGSDSSELVFVFIVKKLYWNNFRLVRNNRHGHAGSLRVFINVLLQDCVKFILSLSGKPKMLVHILRRHSVLTLRGSDIVNSNANFWWL